MSLWEVVAALAPMGIALLVYWYIKGRHTLDQIDTLFPRSRDGEHAQDSPDLDGQADEDDGDGESEIA